MSRVKLTEKFIASKARVPKPGKRNLFLDALVPGMALRVSDRGHRSFVLVARYPLNPKHPTPRALGDCYLPPKERDSAPAPTMPEIRSGVLTLAQARDKARVWLDLIARGVDPRVETEKERARSIQRQSNNFAAVAAAFIAEHVKGPALCKLEEKAGELRGKNPELTEEVALEKVLSDRANRSLVERSKQEGLAKRVEMERIIKREFVKRWATRPVTDIEAEEVSAVIKAIGAHSGVYHTFNIFRILKQLFNWALATRRYQLGANPCNPLDPDTLIGERFARNRTLNDPELRQVWEAAGELGYPYGPAIQLLIVTGQRLREVADMSWGEIDFDRKLWTIPSSRTKTDRAHEVPMSTMAIALLRDQPRFTSSYVFSTTAGAKPVNGFSKAKVRLDRLIAAARAEDGQSEMPPWVLHDLRRTMRTHLSALPVEDIVRELVIGHAQKGLHRVYDQHRYAEEKRQCLDLWAARLKATVKPPPENVADIGKARAKRKAQP